MSTGQIQPWTVCKLCLHNNEEPCHLHPMYRCKWTVKFAVALGISRGSRISNILDLLISHMNTFTKHFCQTVWSCCICLRHDDDNIKWGWVGKVLWGSVLSMQCSLLSKSYGLELNYFLSVSVRGPDIQCLVMTRPNCKPLKESLPLCFRT